jgi:hypothetical protein
MPYYHFTRVSGNGKTGPIPVTTTSRDTCPDTCAFKGSGCYAEYGPLKLHWDRVTAGARGGTLDELCAQLRTLPKHQLWRMAQAGDWPGDGRLLDARGMTALAKANQGRRGFGFTHYDPLIKHNACVIAKANAAGLTVNLSANSLAHADQLAALGVGPVVVVLPQGAAKPLRTPAGRFVAVCPASVRSDVTCASCGVCAVGSRKAIIGFPAHGSGARKAEQVILFKPMTRRYDNAGRAASRSHAVA